MHRLPGSRTLPALLDECVLDSGDRLALVVGDSRWSYRQLAARTARIATILDGLGVGLNGGVALLAPNIADWVPIAVATMRCGARLDAVNTWVKAYEMGEFLRRSTASVLVLAGRIRNQDMIAQLHTLIPDVSEPGWHSEVFPHLRHVVVIGDIEAPGMQSWSALVDSAVDSGIAVADRSEPESPAFVVYTSGSTRMPKAVPLVHRDLIVNGFHIGERMGLGPDDRVWLGSPLFWSFGCANALMAVMTHRAALVLQEHFDPESAADLMDREQVTAAYLLPSMIDALVRTSSAARIRQIESLRTGLTIGRPDEVGRAVRNLGISEICNVYGATENYGNCCVTDHRQPLEVRLTTQGTPLPGVEVRVVDESGTVLAPEQPGEMQVRGRITPGYLDDDEANAASFIAGGWYRTGDQVMINSDGSVTFICRIDDMIKTSGINVSPAEVEAFLSTHPDVAEVTVLGAPHPTRSEVVVAFVVARSQALEPGDLIAYARQRIAGYKVPWAVAVVPSVPKTGTGKVLRRELKDDASGLVRELLAREAAP